MIYSTSPFPYPARFFLSDNVMCTCLSFLLDNPSLNQKWMNFERFLFLAFSAFHSWCQYLPGAEIEVPFPLRDEDLYSLESEILSQKRTIVTSADDSSPKSLENRGIRGNLIRRDLSKTESGMGYSTNAQYRVAGTLDGSHANTCETKEGGNIQMITQIPHAPEALKQENEIDQSCKARQKQLRKAVLNEGNDSFSLHSHQGSKRANQDSMLVWQNFIPSEYATLCAVFDGHGPDGHHISRRLRDNLPGILASCWRSAWLSSSAVRRNNDFLDLIVDSSSSLGSDNEHLWLWEEAFHRAFKLMDRQLLKDEDVDCVYSGSTALTLVKLGDDIIIANVGDSRAVLAVRFADSLIPLQLSVDLTPNLPKEADRIQRCKGRVLALRKEPFVKRVWLPHVNSPGLAMARAFGDYILKEYGVISTPEVTHRHISKNDKFVVLATDGVWDVLSNEMVVNIVDNAPQRCNAAQAVVDAAVRAWKVKHPYAKMDDCSVVCLFLDSGDSQPVQASSSPSV
ncbi:hypothetical protein KP509_18G040900 [Ceratopteris richardii]|uniref:PPM-type phosphatase domain-containing protein n=2 Tax=Ceratopteris richardii TaxID=49495 RepID=A0A8T2SNZ8_CERRI|nr:hypothetical protein KP509_18G040900 [Ceratopteris richardii]KAH7365692.1 hypothetical protein KP509_18G040900 [Ceratopteris richardii]